MGERIDNLYQLRYDLVKDLYHQAAQARYAESSGLESLVYKVFGADRLGSIALALDPFWQLPTGDVVFSIEPENIILATYLPVTVSPANRTRVLKCIPGYGIYVDYRRDVRGMGTGVVADGADWRQFYDNPDPPDVTSGHFHLLDQAPINGFIKDTTVKSRIGESRSKRKQDKRSARHEFSQGECEMFIPSIVDESVKYLNGMQSTTEYKWDAAIHHVPSGKPYDLGLKQYVYISSRLEGSTISVDSPSMSNIASSLQTFCLEQFTKNVTSMFSQCLPSRRPYNLVEQLGELKDLPHDVQGLTKLWVDVEKAVGKTAFKRMQLGPGYWNTYFIKKNKTAFQKVGVYLDEGMTPTEAYLAWKFGWSPFLDFLKQLVYSPEKLTKSVNYLIERNGKNTTLSADKRWQQTPAFSPTVTVADLGWYDTLTPTTLVNAQSSVHIRCSVNSGIRFPDIDLPTFRQTLYWRELGAYPSPSDIYDLIPWSWFVDWFSGLGDYVHLMSEINMSSDRSPINYGFMTAHVNTVWTYARDFVRNETFSIGDPTRDVSRWTVKHPYQVSGTVAVKYYLRRSIQSVLAQPTYAGLNLSTDQQAILSALFGNYMGGAKSAGVR